MKELNELYISTDTIDEDLRCVEDKVAMPSRNFRTTKETSSISQETSRLTRVRSHRAEIKHGQEWCLTWLAHLDLAVERCIACCGFDDSDQWETDDSDT
ncbi:hypothetical protein PSHT_12457 [Puccinia striiformis]|uniref:Uncharacterized protein n=1 Tax=Puccinia striiformis TaxID=27350 RepID=A0A2S4UWH7_9BASI|nr:hypothetical protein PSHT_12457 [Puccinia striiformis]